MRYVLIIISLIFSINLNLDAQALSIGIDGVFNDWEDSSAFIDSENDGADYDMLSFSVSNDSAYIYITIALSDEILLNDDNQLYLQIDTDNDPLTGYPVNGIGSELGIDFGDRQAYFTHNSNTVTVYQNDISLRALPTVTSDTFELAIGRDVLPDGINPLFTENTIKLCFIDNATGGDYMPDNGLTYSYTFDETDIGEYEYIDFAKNNPSDIRLLTYNTLYDGLTDPSREGSFERIIKAVNPDIITFNECWDTQWYEAKNILNDWIPLLAGNSWECWKVDNGNITCSKFSIPDNYSVKPGSRITASLVDLPDEYPRDIMIINSHLECCGGPENNAVRQEEVDAIVQFINTIKTEGGAVTLPNGTPFVISGDFNFVGNSQQLLTLLTGDIVNNSTYGDDSPPDWDGSDIIDIISFQTDQKMAYTWEFDSGSYWPGRLDYMIHSDFACTVSKKFTINTRVMSPDRLTEFGLLENDTYIASDHFPKVTDFIIKDAVSIDKKKASEIKIYPNPSNTGIFTIESLNNEKIKRLTVSDINGRTIFNSGIIYQSSYFVNISNSKKGIYFLKVYLKNKEKTMKLLR